MDSGVPGLSLFELDEAIVSEMEAFVAAAKTDAVPVLSLCGKASSAGRLRLDYGKSYSTRGTIGDASTFPAELETFARRLRDF